MNLNYSYVNYYVSFAAIMRKKNYISLLLLTISISFSLNLHGLAHNCEHDHHLDVKHIGHHDHEQEDEEKETCQLCLISASENKELIAVFPSQPSISLSENHQVINQEHTIFLSAEVSLKTLYKSDYFNKPPPQRIS